MYQNLVYGYFCIVFRLYLFQLLFFSISLYSPHGSCAINSTTRLSLQTEDNFYQKVLFKQGVHSLVMICLRILNCLLDFDITLIGTEFTLICKSGHKRVVQKKIISNSELVSKPLVVQTLISNSELVTKLLV